MNTCSTRGDKCGLAVCPSCLVLPLFIVLMLPDTPSATALEWALAPLAAAAASALVIWLGGVAKGQLPASAARFLYALGAAVIAVTPLAPTLPWKLALVVPAWAVAGYSWYRQLNTESGTSPESSASSLSRTDTDSSGETASLPDRG